MKTYKEKNPWVIMNVSVKARDEAKKLAKLENKKVGPWIDQLILNNNNNSSTNPDELYSMRQLRNIEQSVEDIRLKVENINLLEETLRIVLDRLPKRTILDKIFK